MKHSKELCTCYICKKDIVLENFNKHLATHFNPIGRNCTAWYKSYFKKDKGVCVCMLCDNEVYSDETGILRADAYEEHLRTHNINRNGK
jgi:hypothetical protein